MKVYFGQLYIRPGINFPFSHIFQHYISEKVTALTFASAKFVQEYGEDFDLIFRMSAKEGLRQNEIRGPTVFRRTKDVEYSIFLPFDVIVGEPDVPRAALRYLFDGVCDVFNRLGIDRRQVAEASDSIIEQVCSDPAMFKSPA